MRYVALLGAMVALGCPNNAALAQKSGGILKMYHRDNPPTLSIHESATNSTMIPIMPVMNNLVLFDQRQAAEQPAARSCRISPSHGAGAPTART